MIARLGHPDHPGDRTSSDGAEEVGLVTAWSHEQSPVRLLAAAAVSVVEYFQAS